MASISASLFSALDGAVDPGVGNWHFPYFNEEMGEAVGGSHAADVMLFGRVTYAASPAHGPTEKQPAGKTPRSRRSSGTFGRSSSRASPSISPGGIPNSCGEIWSKGSAR